MSSRTIPPSVAHLIWNVAPKSLDVERSAHMIMVAVLSKGELDDARWLLDTYGRERIRDFVDQDIHARRELPRAARKLWAALLCPEVARAELEDRRGERWASHRAPKSAVASVAEQAEWDVADFDVMLRMTPVERLRNAGQAGRYALKYARLDLRDDLEL